MSRLAQLAFVIKDLGIRASEVLSDGDDGIEARVRIQKVVYFLKRLGFDIGYEFDIMVKPRPLGRGYPTTWDRFINTSSTRIFSNPQRGGNNQDPRRETPPFKAGRGSSLLPRAVLVCPRR